MKFSSIVGKSVLINFSLCYRKVDKFFPWLIFVRRQLWVFTGYYGCLLYSNTSRHSSCSNQWKLNMYNLHRMSSATPLMRMTSPPSNKSDWRCRMPTTRRFPCGPSECGVWVSSPALCSPSWTSYSTTGLHPLWSPRSQSKLWLSPLAGSWRRFCQRLGSGYAGVDLTRSQSIRVPSTWKSTLWFLYLQMLAPPLDVARRMPSQSWTSSKCFTAATSRFSRLGFSS